MPDTVLVAGGAGYIGSHLVSLLLDRGYLVRVLDANLYDSPAFERFRGEARCTVLRGDIRHIEDLAPAIRGACAVVDLAAIVGDEACEKDAAAAETINFHATELLSSLCRSLGVRRLVFASTCSVYGASTGTVLSEESPTQALSLYAETKLESERILLRHPSPTERVVLRLATVYGLSQRMRFDLVLNFFTARADSGLPLVVYGGDQIRPLVHVKDAARAFMAAVEGKASAVSGQIFNVGSNEQNVRIADLAQQVRASVPGASVELRVQDRDRRDYHVCFDKIRETLGFCPQVRIQQGIDEILQALRSGSLGDHREDKYYNVRYVYRNA